MKRRGGTAPEERWMKKLSTVIVYILIVLVAAAIVVMEVSSRRAEQAKLQAAAALETARRPYLLEQVKINTRLAELNVEQKVAAPDLRSMHILFVEPDARIMTDVLPMLEPTGDPATVAVSEAFFPGDAGCLTAAEVQKLTELGWDVCLSVTAETDVAALYARVLAAGIAAPQAAYFPEGDCTVAAEAALAELGIPVVIQYGDVKPVDGEAAACWFLRACGTLDPEVNSAFDSALYGNTGMVLTEGWQRPHELFTQGDFQENLDFIAEQVAQGMTTVMSVSEAHRRYSESEALRIVDEQSWQAEREQLLARLEEIEAALAELDGSADQE